MKSKRQSQVGELIRRAFSTVLQAEGPYIYGHDKLVTITSVDVTPDFAIAKVYLSIFNADDKDEVMGLMQQSTSMLRSKLAQRISKKVRRLPDLHFFLDETVDEMYRVNQLLDGLKKKEE
ncbi:MAG TPA: 30S ribosome-binding factor RbfA [Saprospiraceae bacterium]|nr:30S ribosome-binding factor RbfA [Saprospiraceae bacterium]